MRFYMSKRRSGYRDIDKYYESRHGQHKRYYDRLAVNNENNGQRWSLAEIKMVLAHEVPDRVLSEKIGRSVKAIQEARRIYRDRPIEEPEN